MADGTAFPPAVPPAGRAAARPRTAHLLVSGGLLVPSHVRKGHCVGRYPFPLRSTGEIWYGLFRSAGQT